GGEARPRRIGHLRELAASGVAVEQAPLLIAGTQVNAVYLGIDVAVDHEQVAPGVVVKIQKSDAPAQVFGVRAQAGGEGHVGEGTVGVVAIEGGRVVGEVGFANIGIAVAVVVRNCHSHACLFAAVVVVGSARVDGGVDERAVAIVAVE